MVLTWIQSRQKSLAEVITAVENGHPTQITPRSTKSTSLPTSPAELNSFGELLEEPRWLVSPKTHKALWKTHQRKPKDIS